MSHSLKGFLLVLSLLPGANLEGQTQAKVTRQEFKTIQWIVGTWRGSGGAYPAFYEEYRLLNDSTIRMRAFKDSTLRVVTDSSTIEWRGGFVRSLSPQATYVAIAFTPTSVTFTRHDATQGSHTFARVSPDEWSATLHPSDPKRPVTVYTMRRIRRQGP